MKFGKKLQHQLDSTIPEWRPNFLCYKQLKKRLKHLWKFSDISLNNFSATVVPGFRDSETKQEMARKRKSPDNTDLDHLEGRKKRLALPLDEKAPEGQSPSSDAGHRSQKDENFIRLVKTELGKFNSFVLEKEEEFLIRCDVLQRRTQELNEKYLQGSGECEPWVFEEMIKVRKQLVTLHGEMVLLMNYSSLNYIGLVKILKKHDKQTGANLSESVLVIVLHQPFFSTKNLKELVERCLECEDNLRSLYAPCQVEGDLAKDATATDSVESEAIPRQVLAALQTIQDMRAS